MLTIIFWILFALCFLGVFVPPASYPWIPRANTFILLVLIGILGFKALPHVPL